MHKVVQAEGEGKERVSAVPCAPETDVGHEASANGSSGQAKVGERTKKGRWGKKTDFWWE